MAFVLSGCAWIEGGGGNLEVRSLGHERVALGGSFEYAYYETPKAEQASFLLSDVSPDKMMEGGVQNARVMHIELLWQPMAGKTPLDPTATNASVRYVIVSEGEVGIYVGAGFATVSGTPGDETLSLSVHDASMELAEHTAGFRDLLSPGELSGSFTAKKSEEKAKKLHYGVSQVVTNTLGTSRFVMR